MGRFRLEAVTTFARCVAMARCVCWAGRLLVHDGHVWPSSRDGWLLGGAVMQHILSAIMCVDHTLCGSYIDARRTEGFELFLTLNTSGKLFSSVKML